jgi:ribosomal protein S18 acetylase RimI-like enzyme
MIIRPTIADDWAPLKRARLAALLDAPTAFGVSHATAATYSEAQWRERAAGAAGPVFWLAFDGDGDGDGDGEAVGMVGGGVDRHGHYNLIAMWVTPTRRGSNIAARLVDAVKAHARALGHARVVLDVAPDNLRAARFYERQGFVFIDEWEPLASHPDILVQKMAWRVPAVQDRGSSDALAA